MRFLTFLARRFVAGESLEEALGVVRDLNAEGLRVTLDHLGEDTSSPEQAARDVREYCRMLEALHRQKADANVSLKLTQLGLGFSPKLARENLALVLDQARRNGNFVRIDMEGSAFTSATLDLYRDIRAEYPDVGVVIQAMLRRSAADVEALVGAKGRVRLCKGAYKEPPELAWPDKADVNAAYDRLAERLLDAPAPAFATHDEDRIRRVVAAADRRGIRRASYEIQMLYGLRAARWRSLRDEGHAVRVYVPYGTHWLPYFYRRLRERKENIYFVVKNIFG